MFFGNGVTIPRDRRAQTTDPYNPSRSVDSDWDPDLTVAIENAYIGPSSASAQVDPTRSQEIIQKSLYCDPSADVRKGDRVRDGGTVDDLSSGTAYMVDETPDAARNPFTGWQPLQEIPLKRVEG